MSLQQEKISATVVLIYRVHPLSATPAFVTCGFSFCFCLRSLFCCYCCFSVSRVFPLLSTLTCLICLCVVPVRSSLLLLLSLSHVPSISSRCCFAWCFSALLSWFPLSLFFCVWRRHDREIKRNSTAVKNTRQDGKSSGKGTK